MLTKQKFLKFFSNLEQNREQSGLEKGSDAGGGIYLGMGFL